MPPGAGNVVANFGAEALLGINSFMEGLSAGYEIGPMLAVFQRPLIAKEDAGILKTVSEAYHKLGMVGTISALSLTGDSSFFTISNNGSAFSIFLSSKYEYPCLN